jgi:hypothetical protein
MSLSTAKHGFTAEAPPARRAGSKSAEEAAAARALAVQRIAASIEPQVSDTCWAGGAGLAALAAGSLSRLIFPGRGQAARRSDASATRQRRLRPLPSAAQVLSLEFNIFKIVEIHGPYLTLQAVALAAMRALGLVVRARARARSRGQRAGPRGAH